MGRTAKRLCPGALVGLLCLASVALATACADPSSPAPLPTHTPFPTSIPTPPPTDTPPQTSTPEPTAIPESTQVATPLPTAAIPPRTAPALVPTSTPTLASMVEEVTLGVVQIVTSSGTGSGFIIDEEGLVVTNAHVVEGFAMVDVRLANGQSYPGEVLGVDASTDVALLDLWAYRDFKPVALGDSNTVSVGEEVIAMGYPLGGNDILLGSASVTSGILSAKRTSRFGIDLLQTDAAVNPGSSGGPLFDRDGRVIGVNTLKIFESGDGRPVEGIGLAVAINEVRDRLDTLAKGGEVIPPSPSQDTTDGTLTPVSGGSFVNVSAGVIHNCGVKADGSVVCWGANKDSDGNLVGQATPPNGSFTSVSAGGLHTCGIRTDDVVVCWGGNEDNDGNVIGQATPPNGSFTSISAGAYNTCGVKTDSSVVCWGDDSKAQSTPPRGSFNSVSAGGWHSCGVQTDSAVVCWGSDSNGQSTPPAGAFSSVSAGGGHTCGVKADGSVVCWGNDSLGQSTQPPGSFTSVSTGTGHTCGVKTDGSVECWGLNDHGQSTPPSGSFVSVGTGFLHTCGLRSDGSVACWGNDSAGQTTPPQAITAIPTMVPTPTVPFSPVPTFTPTPTVSFASMSAGGGGIHAV